MQPPVFNFDEITERLLKERARLEEIRSSIERCEALPRVDSQTAIDYHKPARRLKPLS